MKAAGAVLAAALLAAGCGGEDPASGPGGGTTRDRRDEGSGGTAETRPSVPVRLPDLPELTGDREADRTALLAALKATQAQLMELSQEWSRYIKDGKTRPPAEVVSRLERDEKALSARAEKLQEMLDQLKD